MTNEGNKWDENKLRYDLIPPDGLVDIVKILTDGATKYGERNWELGMSWSRLYAAAMRHLQAWAIREDNDPESGMFHMAHACTNLLFLLTYQHRGIGIDDRPEIKGELK
jgi:hypothetical protein